MREVVVVTKNEVGTVAKIAEMLGDLGVNIDAISAYGTETKAVTRILTADSASTVRALSKIPESQIREGEILIVKLPNRAGELGKLSRKIADKGINLETVYIVSRRPDYTEVAVKPLESDLLKAKEALGIRD
ncbi:ACT domain-containing protein [Candidatus Micrarchaeota archaeon]|nr:ACT domain-containing protein [Candidatus Micrarchaeota archaeon]